MTGGPKRGGEVSPLSKSRGEGQASFRLPETKTSRAPSDLIEDLSTLQ